MRFRRVYRTVFVKEFGELLRDRRALFWLFAPPILLPMIALCGAIFVSIQTVRIASDGFAILVENADQAPELVRRLEATQAIDVIAPPPQPEQDPFGKAVVIVSLPQDFQEQLYESHTVTIELITRDSSTSTLLGQSIVRDAIQNYANDLVDERLAAQDLNRAWLNPIYITESKRMMADSAVVDSQGDSGFLSTLFLPLAVTSWLLGGGMGLILDTTVGEKERKTIENLLVTPASRAGIVMGKMTVVFFASLAVMGLWLTEGLLLSTLSSAAPTLIEMESVSTSQALEVLLESGGDVLRLIAVLLALVIPFTAMLNSLVIAWCAYAANYREANLFMALLQLSLPASVLLTVFSVPARVSLHYYALPFFGAIVAIRDLFSGTLPTTGLAVNLLSGLVYTVGSVWLAAWMFNREWALTRGL